MLKLVVGSSEVPTIDAACSSIVRACHEHLKICKLERDSLPHAKRVPIAPQQVYIVYSIYISDVNANDINLTCRTNLFKVQDGLSPVLHIYNIIYIILVEIDKGM